MKFPLLAMTAALIALSFSFLGATRPPQTETPTTPMQIVSTASFENRSADDFNTAVNSLYQQGCRFAFQLPAPIGAPIGSWIEFTCNGSPAAETKVLSTYDFHESGPEGWNSAVAELQAEGYQEVFWVTSAPGVHVTSWVIFANAGAQK
jgi:hypothetical protein